jgi:hypothetical protein
VQVTATRYDGILHDFVLLNGIHDVPAAQAAIVRRAMPFAMR